MDLIRLLLLQHGGEEPAPDLSGYSEEAIVYHSVLLIEAGLVNGPAVFDASEGRDIGAVVLRLTWAGHEFLDSARDETIWRKTMAQLQKVGGRFWYAGPSPTLISVREANAWHPLTKTTNRHVQP
jgi:hypothetical protein